jgi:hypothetical protein
VEALPEGLRSCGKRTTAWQVLSVACPNKSTAGPERTETAVETTNFEANPEATDAVVERQEHRERLVVRLRRWAKKRTLHCKRVMFVRAQTGTALEEETRK